jgi:hypothetical protein
MLKTRIVFLLFVFAAFAATARAQGDPFVLGNANADRTASAHALGLSDVGGGGYSNLKSKNL